MTVFVTVCEGDSAKTATPLLATHDPRIVGAIVRELVRCLGISDAPSRVLALARRTNEDESPSQIASNSDETDEAGQTQKPGRD